NFCETPAMSVEQRDIALEAGRAAADRAATAGVEAFIGGEMGIGNTTAAVALACALLDERPSSLVGPGTGLDAAGIAHKAQVVERALQRHEAAREPFAALAALGGFEIAALAGAYIAAAGHRMPVLVDGFIASVAALVAVREVPAIAPWLICAHRSAEPGHERVLQALAAAPVIDLGMRLGEGSGAAVAVPILRTACALHNGMATFAEAGVSTE
ncbi:MAG: nicotinate-nucleotide--dimethylbenzimidazole phosphoribosyltransferase, partial [Halofilum sp. (in: g-proteobacteria)]